MWALPCLCLIWQRQDCRCLCTALLSRANLYRHLDLPVWVCLLLSSIAFSSNFYLHRTAVHDQTHFCLLWGMGHLSLSLLLRCFARFEALLSVLGLGRFELFALVLGATEIECALFAFGVANSGSSSFLHGSSQPESLLPVMDSATVSFSLSLRCTYQADFLLSAFGLVCLDFSPPALGSAQIDFSPPPRGTSRTESSSLLLGLVQLGLFLSLQGVAWF